jgi:hypothetical protein
MKKNWLTTVGGIMALFGAIPIALGTAGVHMPSWLYIVCISCSVIGPGIVGIAAKGQDEHSTAAQVAQSGGAVPPPPPAQNAAGPGQPTK